MCTGIQLKTTSGAPIYGRTMEFADNLASAALVIPKGQKFTAAGPSFHTPGKSWVSQYDITGLNTDGLPLIIDGINSEGLCVGAFYFVGYAGYMDVSEKDADESICSIDVPVYLLSNCKTVEEVKTALLAVKVNKGSYGSSSNTTDPVPLHYNIHDAMGNVLVVEYINGELQMHDNPIGVLTNSPDYKWHYTNLSNYVNLTPDNKKELRLKNMSNTGKELNPILPTGQGSGLLGIPGDYTPPSRFVRALFYSKAVVPVKENEEAVMQAFHILDAFDIPVGTIRALKGDQPSLEYTQWTVASDLEQRRFYFHTVGNRTIHLIDLANWKFTSDEIVTMAISEQPTIINMADQSNVEALR